MGWQWSLSQSLRCPCHMPKHSYKASRATFWDAIISLHLPMVLSLLEPLVGLRKVMELQGVRWGDRSGREQREREWVLNRKGLVECVKMVEKNGQGPA